MNLRDVVDQAELRAAETAGLITVREAHGLEIRNYSPQATYTPGSWAIPAVRTCRGLISNPATGMVVARPWAKFFNYGQDEAGHLDFDASPPVEVTDKLDGSLGIVYRDPVGVVRVATRGSMLSEQALHATDWLNRQDWTQGLRDLNRITALTEIIYPENRIVCDYGRRNELVLLGGVEVETGAYLSPAETGERISWHGAVVDVFEYGTLRDALAAPARDGAEGLCVRLLGENRIVKMKQEDYVRVHRIVTGLSAKSVWRHMLEHGVSYESLGDLLGPLPDEFHDWTRVKWTDIHDAYTDILNRAKIAHTDITSALPSGFARKDYALEAVKYGELRGFLFMLLDDRDPSSAILRKVEPVGNHQPREFETE